MRPYRPVLAAAALVLSACTSSPASPDERELDLGWTEVVLPVAEPGWRPVLRDILHCGRRSVVVGGLTQPDGSTRPAVWTSRDGTSWATADVVAREYYARQAIISSAGCLGGRLTLLGAKAGGAHSLPRVRTFFERPTGTIVAAKAPPGELFGGPSTISVSRVAGGDDGVLISGTRSAGAAVWSSRRGRTFRMIDDLPSPAGRRGLQTTARDATYADGQWTVVGSGSDASGARVPLAWVSPDGVHWSPQPIGATRGFSTMERVVASGNGLVATGLHEGRFGLWQRSASSWKAHPAFGEITADGGAAPYVTGLTATAHHVICSTSDGARFRVWVYDHTRWEEMPLPTSPVTTTGDHNVVVSAAGQRLLMLTDDGESPRIWVSDWPVA